MILVNFRACRSSLRNSPSRNQNESLMSSQGTSHRNAWEHAAPYRQATARFVVLGVCHRSPSLVGSTTESRLINADGNLW